MTPTTADKVKEIIESFMGAYYGGRPIEAVLEYFDEWASSPSGSRLVGELGEGWVSVEDRLPENGQRILFCDNKDLFVGDCFKRHPIIHFIFTGVKITTGYDEMLERVNVTHWQPLPEPPKINNQ